MSGTSPSSAGNPSGSAMKGFSFASCRTAWPRELRAPVECINPIWRASRFIVVPLLQSTAATENRANGLRSTRESHRHRIHAIAQTCRGRAVVENVPQMCVTTPARNCRSDHTETVVGGFQNIFFRNRRPKTWPACTRFELCARIEQRRVAANAAKHTFRVLVWIFIRIGKLGSGMSRDFKRTGGELLPPLVFRFYNGENGHHRFALA
jgi:hypothetical protein